MSLPTFNDLCDALSELYHETANVSGGKNADYIPELAAVNSELFAIAAVDTNGRFWSIGDDTVHFSLQSTVKPLLYLHALEEKGLEQVNNIIGHEPSGQKFNAFVLDEKNMPHNPLINAGAIASATLIASNKKAEVDNFKGIRNLVDDAAGHICPVLFDNSVFLSELNTASRNFALFHFMREHHSLFDEVSAEQALRLYFSACSLSINVQGLAAIGSTLANQGVCPLTNKQVIPQDYAQSILQLMYSCGMYDYSGRFAFEVGIPAKSGVSGAVVLAVPGKFGIAIWSPPLDAHGNSVRGVTVAKALATRFPALNIFKRVQTDVGVSRQSTILEKRNVEFRLIHACSEGLTEEIRELLTQQKVDANSKDYDGRTPLHLACVEGHLEAVKVLLEFGADPFAKDRFGSTPVSDAAKFPEISKLLRQQTRSKSCSPQNDNMKTSSTSKETARGLKLDTKAGPLLVADKSSTKHVKTGTQNAIL
jgi:glutaminase